MTHLRHTVSYDSASGGVFQNVYHWDVSPNLPLVATSSQTVDIAERMGDMYATLVSIWDDTTGVREHKTETWDAVTETWNLYTQASVVGIDGLQVSQSVSAGVAALVSVPVVGGGRSMRKYLGGLAETEVVDGTLSAPANVALIAYGLSWVTPFTGTFGHTFTTVNFRQASNTFQDIQPVTNVDQIMAYQRRRKPGVGI